MNRSRLRSYLLQSLLGGLAMLAIVAAGAAVSREVVIIPLGASVFILFAMPRTGCAAPKDITLGYAARAVGGLLGYYLLAQFAAHWAPLVWCACALSVALSIFLMAALRAEHPPAAAMAVTVAFAGFDPLYLLAALAGVLCLVALAWLLRNRLVNLF